MIPILNSIQLRELDEFTIKNEPVSSVDLMERAANRCSEKILEDFSFERVAVLCGPGNNGGDGLAIARILLSKNKQVDVFIATDINVSQDFKTNLLRLASFNIEAKPLTAYGEHGYDLAIDALFGSGLSRPLSNNYQDIVLKLNSSKISVASIDIPSGMPVFPEFAITTKNCVLATKVYCIQLPKLSMLLPYADGFYSDFELIDIGLMFENFSSDYYYVLPSDCKDIALNPSKFSHKYTRGSVTLVGGSEGKTGSIILSSEAALRSGCGVVNAVVPESVISAMQCRLPEVMCAVNGKDYINTAIDLAPKTGAIGFGPGISFNKDIVTVIEGLLESEIPLIIDADALRIIAHNKLLKEQSGRDIILTPHEGEFRAFVGDWSTDLEKLKMLMAFAESFSCIVVLKGAYTAVCDGNKIYFNSNGDPAMATAGSGDVLLGVIASLRAQGLSSLESAILGVHIHALAAEIYLETNLSLSLIASDIAKNLGSALKHLKAL